MLFPDSIIKYLFIRRAEYPSVSPIDTLTNSISFESDCTWAVHNTGGRAKNNERQRLNWVRI